MAGATLTPKRVTMADAVKDARESAGSYKGIWSWLATVDHKRIGIMYGVTSFLFFLVGGIEALLIRVQLARARERTS